MQDVHMKLNPGLPWQKQHSSNRRLFPPENWADVGKKLVKCYIWSIALYGVEMLQL
jgi:hypothetical protein